MISLRLRSKRTTERQCVSVSYATLYEINLPDAGLMLRLPSVPRGLEDWIAGSMLECYKIVVAI